MKKSQGLRQYMIIIFTIFGISLIAIIFPIVSRSVNNMEEALIADRLVADIHYIEDLIGNGEWNLKDGYICRGDVKIGDGTKKHANLDPFLLHEKKTGTFSYVFIRCSDEGLSYVEDTPTEPGYQEGHFLRVAGSTRNTRGESIIGTYMDKKVADILDANDTYDGEANVAGRMIYCRYDTLKDANGKVVGAIVVGRGIEELKGQVARTIRIVIYVGVGAIVLGCIILLLIMNRWVAALGKSTRYLEKIETGNIPSSRLSPQGVKEIDILNEGINSLADTIKENEELRIKSETDQLTGLANRFGLNHHGGEMFNACIRNEEMVSLGILDIDFFKLYNDNYGHQIGDECIKKIADILKKIEEPGRIFAARYGGDEFIVVTRGLQEDELEELADRIRNDVIKANIPHAYSKSYATVTVSQGHYIGIPQEGQSLSSYFTIADHVMYDVKNGSKNGYRIVNAGTYVPDENKDDPDAPKAQAIDWSTYHDYLTQLFNREGFYRDVERILKEDPDGEYYLVRSNIRDFKLVNQLFGYEKGNEILVETAGILRNGNAGIVSAGRIHGDHFVFLIPKDSFDEDALRESFAKHSGEIEGSQYVLQYHLGIYPIQDKSMDVSIMCDRASLAISSIRPESDLAIAYYDDSMMEHILKENVVIAEFEKALSEGEFRVFLQPIVDSQERLVGAEALARWARNKNEAVVIPDDFIPILERAGLIHKLDSYVWEEAARMLDHWKGTPLADIFISVNISPRDIVYVDIEKTLEDLTERYKIRHDQLNPEFTETTLISDTKRYIALVSALGQKGFNVEIDDFGSGYSSLNMLKDIHADVLKIDKDFLGDTEDQYRNRSILASIVEMSKKLNMKVIAEGVETKAQFNALQHMGCDLFQGFYYSKPVALDEFEDCFLKSR